MIGINLSNVSLATFRPYFRPLTIRAHFNYIDQSAIDRETIYAEFSSLQSM